MTFLGDWPLVKEIENLFLKDVTWQSTFFLSQQAFYLLWDQWLQLALLRLKGRIVKLVLIRLLVTKPTMLVCQSSIKYLNMVLLESVKCLQVWQVGLFLFLLLLCIIYSLTFLFICDKQLENTCWLICVCHIIGILADYLLGIRFITFAILLPSV